jgi:hypothetical protein
MSKKHSYVIAILFTTALLLPFVMNIGSQKVIEGYELIPAERKSLSGIHYQLFHAGRLRLDLTSTRPLKTDKTVFLCVAGAFTDLKTDKIDGIYLENGKISNRESINHQLGGAIRRSPKGIDIFPPAKGAIFNDSFIRILSSDKSSLFQQIQMIHKGKGETYTDDKIFQRRAIVQFMNNDMAIIESREDITLAQFTKDLLEFDAFNAIYTDMGTWDEGWYRSGEQIITLGKYKSQTARQSNWVILTSQ